VILQVTGQRFMANTTDQQGSEARSPGRGTCPERAFLEALPLFAIALDGEGLITLWNRRLAEISGYTAADMLGQPGGALLGANEVCSLPIKGGGQLQVRWTRVSLRDGAAAAASTYAIGQDVTAQEELLRRTLRAERLAAVGTLAAGLAHEVRNPLNAAGLQLQVLRRRLLRADGGAGSVEPVLESIEHEIGRLERLITDFISFVQPPPLTVARVSLQSLCQGVVQWASGEAEGAGLTITCHVDPGLPEVQADPERLRHVLQNLLRNAIEATPAGGMVDLRARLSTDGGRVEIDVSDTGEGFKDEAPIFDAFFTTKPKGTGLGLAIVHRIVSDHGGTVRVRSQPGGTCFTVSLPASEAPAGSP
jgi:signal transduction histidine kinase